MGACLVIDEGVGVDSDEGIKVGRFVEGRFVGCVELDEGVVEPRFISFWMDVVRDELVVDEYKVVVFPSGEGKGFGYIGVALGHFDNEVLFSAYGVESGLVAAVVLALAYSLDLS